MWFCVSCPGRRRGLGALEASGSLNGLGWGPAKKRRERMLVCFHIILSYYFKVFYFQNNVEN